MLKFTAIAITFATLTAGSAAAASCTIQSGDKQRPVIMLFTSEGCSSCPPADRWASELHRSGKHGALVLGFHVAYWDYIGWKDRFAQPAFTDLQRRVSSQVGMTTIYTPQVMLQGKEWRNWHGVLQDRSLSSTATQMASATIALSLQKTSAHQLPVTLDIKASENTNDKLEAFVALTENGLSSKVSAGENRGESLKHDAVVRTLAGPFPLVRGALSKQIVLSVPADAKTANMHVAAFVADARSGQVVQGAGGRVCE